MRMITDMNTATFYRDLKPFKNFRDITNPDIYTAVPDDWSVLITDVKNSTVAIKQNRYKDVNVIGASCIIAVLNALGSSEHIPFVFGGDGASFLLPPHLVDVIVPVIQAARDMAQDSFDLELRAGIVPVSDLAIVQKEIKIAKYAISNDNYIAMITGGGISHIDRMIKDYEDQYDIKQFIANDAVINADFSGLECRWKPIENQKGEMLTMIVSRGEDQREDCYIDLLNTIHLIYGEDLEYRPNNETNLKLSFNTSNLRAESKLQSYKKSFIQKFSHYTLMLIEILLGKALFKWKLKLGEFDGQKYMDRLLANTDFQKFDDDLRMVIDSTAEQSKQLQNYLDTKHKAGRLYYGMHRSNNALMTCMVLTRLNNHLHFIDGGDGGYTLAAKALKEQKLKSAT